MHSCQNDVSTEVGHLELIFVKQQEKTFNNLEDSQAALIVSLEFQQLVISKTFFIKTNFKLIITKAQISVHNL